MKKLGKILNDGEQERHNFSSIDTDIKCDCCSWSSEQSSTPGMNGKSDEREPTLKPQVQVNDHRVKRSWLQIDDKSLIILGLAFTIPIVILDILVPHRSISNEYLMLALATAVQILLGRPFYYRFLQAIKYRKRFTTDTLVVLSTTVAYLYSLFSLIFTSSHIQFFEASSSVLVIFTIGEYLESRVLKTTNES
jgi:P-type Cu+ transporter